VQSLVSDLQSLHHDGREEHVSSDNLARDDGLNAYEIGIINRVRGKEEVPTVKPVRRQRSVTLYTVEHVLLPRKPSRELEEEEDLEKNVVGTNNNPSALLYRLVWRLVLAVGVVAVEKLLSVKVMEEDHHVRQREENTRADQTEHEAQSADVVQVVVNERLFLQKQFPDD